MGGAHQTVNRHSRIIERHPLPLPLGEVAERSEDGEGKQAAIPSQSPSLTALPEGEPRARWREKNGAHPCRLAYRAGTPCLSLGERWPSAARTERGNRASIPSQSPSVTALPKGEPRGCTRIWAQKRSVSVTDTLRSLFCDHPSKGCRDAFVIRTGITAG